jgi:hypothetical protein
VLLVLNWQVLLRQLAATHATLRSLAGSSRQRFDTEPSARGRSNQSTELLLQG